MDTSSHNPYITLDEIRQLVRSCRKQSVPDYVARALRNRPVLVPWSEAEEIAGIAGGLVEQARARLHTDGFEPPKPTAPVASRMPKRDRDRAEHLAILLALQGTTLAIAGQPNATACAVESVEWARLAGCHQIESQSWLALTRVYHVTGQASEELEAHQRSLEAARRSSDPHTLVDALEQIAPCLLMRGKLAEAEKMLVEAGEIVAASFDEVDAADYRAKIWMTLGQIAMMRRDGETALTHFREALRLANEQRDPLTYMGLLSHLGAAYSVYGDERRNIECQQRMVGIAESRNDTIAAAWGFYRIGSAYFYLGDNEQAEKAFEMSLRYAPLHVPLPQLYVLLKRAEICAREKRIDEGLQHCRTILEAVTEDAPPMLAVMTQIQIGLLEHERGEFAKAERAYRRALELSGANSAVDRSTNVQVHLAKALIELGRESEAETMVIAAAGIEPRDIGDEQIVAEACRVLSEIAERRGDLAEALRYSRELNTRDRLVMRRQTEESLQKARVLAEVDRLEREAALEREHRRRAESDLAQAVLSLRGRDELLERVEHQLHRALAGITAEKAREISVSVRTALEQIDVAPTDTDHPLGYLHTLDTQFFESLRSRYPDLTRKQERLCGLIRAGLTSQEIATLLGLGVEGLRAQRKRLRRKLGLDAEESLEHLIVSI